MGAFTAHEHFDTVIKGADTMLGQRALLNDLKRVPGATTQWAVLARALDAAVWIHAVR